MHACGTLISRWSWLAASLVAAMSLTCCLAIEVQNYRAGNYLPRSSKDEEKWRISPSMDERDCLRGRVINLGLPQYGVVPVLLLWALMNWFGSRHRDRVTAWIAGTWCFSVVLFVGVLALHRDYLGSLGW